MESIVEKHVATLENPCGFTMEPLELDRLSYLSPSKLKEFSRSPAHFKYRYIDDNPRDDTPAMRIGRIVHWALLQPAEFNARYVLEPEFKGTGCRAAKQDWIAGLPEDAIVLKDSEADKILGMINAVQDNVEAKALLSNGTPESCMYANLEEFGGLWMMRPDFIRNDDWIVEVKSTKNAARFSFAKDIDSFNYHLQLYMYGKIYKAITGRDARLVFLAIEKEPPYCMAKYNMGPMTSDHIVWKTRNLIAEYTKCCRTNAWPGYPDGISEIEIPAYARYRDEEEAGLNA